MAKQRSTGAGVAAATISLLLTGCSGASSGPASASNDPVTRREQIAVDELNLKQHYKDIVMGTEVKGQTLVVYVDVDNLYSMDESSEDALRAQTLRQWTRIWSASHPHKHTLLRLSLRDYYGNEVTGDSARI
jgi:hypothetical protein